MVNHGRSSEKRAREASGEGVEGERSPGEKRQEDRGCRLGLEKEVEGIPVYEAATQGAF